MFIYIIDEELAIIKMSEEIYQGDTSFSERYQNTK